MIEAVPTCEHTGDGSTIGLKIHTCHSDGENEQCNVSGVCEVCRNSSPSTLPFSTTSPWIAVFQIAITSSRTALLF